jgi:hypothetical protein
VNKRKSDAPLAMSTSSRENSIIGGASCVLAAVARMYPMQLTCSLRVRPKIPPDGSLHAKGGVPSSSYALRSRSPSLPLSTCNGASSRGVPGVFTSRASASGDSVPLPFVMLHAASLFMCVRSALATGCEV